MKKTFLFSFMLCLSLMGSAQNKKDFWQLNNRKVVATQSGKETMGFKL